MTCKQTIAQVRTELKKLPGVVGVGIGLKEVAGQLTDAIADPSLADVLQVEPNYKMAG